MKKYISIFKMSMTDNFQGIEALLFKFLSYFVNMFVLSCVWKYIYSDPSRIINGYTLVQMIWYILFADTISYGASRIVVDEIQNDVITGTIAYKINKPYKYVLYIFTRSFADSLIRTSLYFIVSIIIGVLYVGPLNVNLSIGSVLAIALTFILSVIITNLIKITITLLSFWTEDSEPFHWIYNKTMLIFGIFFPIEMFPLFIQKILVYTPVYTTLYGPAKLALDYSNGLFINVLIAQIIYVIVVSIICALIFRKGVKNLNVNGG